MNAHNVHDQFENWENQMCPELDRFQGIHLSPKRENYVIEPEEYRDDHQDYSLFDRKENGYNKTSDFGFRDESKMENEEYKESGPGAGKTVRAHTK